MAQFADATDATGNRRMLPLFFCTTAGNGYFGISANDCIRHARELAGRIATGTVV